MPLTSPASQRLRQALGGLPFRCAVGLVGYSFCIATFQRSSGLSALPKVSMRTASRAASPYLFAIVHPYRSTHYVYTRNLTGLAEAAFSAPIDAPAGRG